jgi:hypothetical protein
MHIIVYLAKLMAQRRILPTSQILTRMKLYILILTDNLKTPAFSLLPVPPEESPKTNSPKEKCSHSSVLPVYQKNAPPSSSATELLLFLRIHHTLSLPFLFT